MLHHPQNTHNRVKWTKVHFGGGLR